MAKKKAVAAGPACCTGRFPTFGLILFVVGVFWLLADMGYITFNVPWFPLILIVISIGMIVNRFQRR